MKLLFAALLLSLAWIGCSSKESSSSSDNHAKAGVPTGSSNDTAASADRVMDPVSGEWIQKDVAWRTMYKGNWYFFSSKENGEKFASNPTAFVTDDGRVKRELEAK
jgi:YHS domain-containing protein